MISRPCNKFCNKLYCLLIFSLIFNYQCLAEEKRVYKIGYVADFTGTGAFVSDNTSKGAELALSEIAENPDFKDIRIETKFEDIAGKLPNSVSAAIKLITNDKVDALICDLTGPCSAIAPKAFAANIPLIYHSPATSITESFSQAFMNFIDYTPACREIAKHWKKKNVKQIAELNANTEFSQRCSEGLKQVYDQHFIYNYNTNDDLRGAATELRKRHLNHVAFTGYENDFISFIKNSKYQGQNFKLGFIEVMLTNSLWEKLGTTAVSGIVAGFEEASAKFKNNLNKKFPSEKDYNYAIAALSYNAIMSLSHAFKTCPAKNLNCLVEDLKQEKQGMELNFKGFFGKNSYKVVLKSIENKSVADLSQND